VLNRDIDMSHALSCEKSRVGTSAGSSTGAEHASSSFAALLILALTG
jgi:hypothetical protein